MTEAASWARQRDDRGSELSELSEAASWARQRDDRASELSEAARWARQQAKLTDCEPATYVDCDPASWASWARQRAGRGSKLSEPVRWARQGGSKLSEAAGWGSQGLWRRAGGVEPGAERFKAPPAGRRKNVSQFDRKKHQQETYKQHNTYDHINT